MKESKKESELKGHESVRAELEELYQCPLKPLEDKAYFFDLVSQIVGKNGELELKQLIAENRLPIIVGSYGEWYTEWYPEDTPSPLFDLFIGAYGSSRRRRKEPVSPEKGLRLSIAFWVVDEKRRLRRLQQQLINQDEHSFVLQRQIERLDQLNQSLDFLSRKEVWELMPEVAAELAKDDPQSWNIRN
jgi:hypothetical protein